MGKLRYCFYIPTVLMNSQDLPGPGTYIQILPDGTESITKPTSVFASTSKREAYSVKKGKLLVTL